jgi:hypothetical protein
VKLILQAHAISENLQLKLADNNSSDKHFVDIKVVQAADTRVCGVVLADMAENELAGLSPDLLSSSNIIETVDTDVEAGFHPIDYNDDSPILTHDSVAQNQLSPHFEDCRFHKDDQRVVDDTDEAPAAAAETEQFRGKHIRIRQFRMEQLGVLFRTICGTHYRVLAQTTRRSPICYLYQN